MKKGFTLAEVMIVLVVIGVITGILLPTAIQSTPKEDVIKFKKGYTVLNQVIRELITNDIHYKDGDLGIKANGDPLTINDVRYFCETFADVVNAREVNCSDSTFTGDGVAILNSSNIDSLLESYESDENGSAVSESLQLFRKKTLDNKCRKNIELGYSKQIVTIDGIWFYDVAPGMHFGREVKTSDGFLRVFSSPSQPVATFRDENGFDTAYKSFCMDIDGIPEGATNENCINECPFGFGIRADGKIFNGVRADEWLNKTIQGEDN